MQSSYGKKILALEEVSYTYRGESKPALRAISLTIAQNTTCAVVGSSGSGKSTLLNILGLLDEPTSGRLILNDIDMSSITSVQRAIIRNRHIGFVFQGFNLIRHLTVEENVSLPLIYRGESRSQARCIAYEYLEKVGLLVHCDRLPADLSGGQRQRVAIARALAGRPSIILADEPTGNLDSNTACEIMRLLFEINRSHGMTLIVVTHDKKIAKQLDREILVQDGTVTDDRSR